jgi:hypothetical protein
LLVLAAQVRADNIFDLARKPNQRVLLTLDEQPPSAELDKQPAMMQRIRGVLAELKAQQVVDLCAAVDQRAAANKAVPSEETATAVCFVHIDGPAGARHVSISQTPEGVYIATERAAPPASDKRPRCAILKPELLDRLLNNAATGGTGYCGTLEPLTNSKPEVLELPKPYHFSPIQLDATTIRDRIGSSPLIKYSPATRVLQGEKFFARVPQTYDARHPAGLLVYMDPMPTGRPPQPLIQALDKYGFFCISPAAAGNDRFATERLQLALDAVSTARRRWNIDPRRIYITGISGGGKMSSESLICFPDIYTGAVSIVGLSWWENIPTGEGAKMWPAEFSKPTGKRLELLLQHRLAAVTGSNDFNHPPVTAGVKFYERNRVKIRLFDIEGMGHECPSAAAFAEQLGWVDQPARERAEKSSREAEEAMKKAKAVNDPEAWRAALLEVVTKWPWTAGAWEAWGAVKELGK